MGILGGVVVLYDVHLIPVVEFGLLVVLPGLLVPIHYQSSLLQVLHLVYALGGKERSR